jgi:hypothetical protein
MFEIIFGIILIAIIVVPAYACLCLSGRLSDEEERRGSFRD